MTTSSFIPSSSMGMHCPIDTRYFNRTMPILPFGEHYYHWTAPQWLKDYWFRNCEPIEDEL